MAKLTLTDPSVVNQTLAPVITDNNSRVEAALENTLSRDGTSPNEMNANLDMNSNRIINLPAATSATEPLRAGDLTVSTNVNLGVYVNQWSMPIGGFYKDFDDSTKMILMRDRVGIGDAAKSHGNWSFVAGEGSWLWNMEDPYGTPLGLSYLARDCLFELTSNKGNLAFTSASRTSESQEVPSGPDAGAKLDTIAGSFIAIADNTTDENHLGDKLSSWGVYVEAMRWPGAGYAQGTEIEIINFEADSTVCNVYGGVSDNSSMGIWLGSGGAKTNAEDVTVGIALFSNGAKFKKGLAFLQSSLTQDVNGYMTAIDLAQKQKIVWHYSGAEAAIAGFITSTNNDVNAATGIDFGPLGFSVTDKDHNILFRVAKVANAINYVVADTAATGGDVVVRPSSAVSGGDANVRIAIRSRGTSSGLLQGGVAATTCFAWNDTSSVAKVGFFGTAPVVKQTVGAALSTGGAETNTNLATRINEIRTALINYGLAV